MKTRRQGMVYTKIVGRVACDGFRLVGDVNERKGSVYQSAAAVGPGERPTHVSRDSPSYQTQNNITPALRWIRGLGIDFQIAIIGRHSLIATLACIFCKVSFASIKACKVPPAPDETGHKNNLHCRRTARPSEHGRFRALN